MHEETTRNAVEKKEDVDEMRQSNESKRSQTMKRKNVGKRGVSQKKENKMADSEKMAAARGKMAEPKSDQEISKYLKMISLFCVCHTHLKRGIRAVGAKNLEKYAENAES